MAMPAVITANLTRNPEARQSNSGTPIARFAVAHNNRRQDENSEWVDAEPTFFEVSCFGSVARNVVASLVSGDRVTIVGRFQQNSWVDSDGNKRTRLEIVADEVSASLRWAEITITKNAKGEAA